MKKLYVNNKLVAMGDYEIKEVDESPKYEVKVCYDECYDRDECAYWNERTNFYSNHRDYRFNGKVTSEMITKMKEQKDTDSKRYYPVYAFDHSGITLYKEVYNGRYAEWDSGLFGIAEVDNTDGNADGIFNEFFNELKAVVEGDVYEFRIYDEVNEIVDCCGGFYGEGIAESIYENIPSMYGITLDDVKNALDNM